jgi:pyrimidine and pyridine-specific 5'-nucleotidase
MTQAIEFADVKDVSKCYFVDDNRRNVEVAQELGWGHVVHFCEQGLEHAEGGKVKAIREESAQSGIAVISDLEELRQAWPEIFKE